MVVSIFKTTKIYSITIEYDYLVDDTTIGYCRYRPLVAGRGEGDGVKGIGVQGVEYCEGESKRGIAML